MMVDGNDAWPAILQERFAVRCYAPRTSVIVAFVFVGYLALRKVSGHAFADLGLATSIVIALGVAGAVAAAITVSATTIRHRRAAAGACHTCSHPCREALARVSPLV